jgi:benzoyl-CoA reductase/2-hydroxyglutaryl-CoA dehydratase subunit BcrC/BadD/HgdB
MRELPPPSLGVSDNSGICRVWSYHNKVLAEHFNSPKLGSVPKFEIDTPNDYSEDSIKYLAAQLGELVKFTEEHVPGLKYDEDKHKELIEINRTWVNYTLKEWELKKHVPLPMSNMESSLP